MMNIEKKQAYKLLYPRLTVLVSSGDEEEKNVMTVAWSTPISFNPPIVGVSISPKRNTHKLIQRTKKFAINIPTKEFAKETYYAGTKSGKELNKFKETDLSTTEGETGVPLIKECYANIECEVMDNPIFGDHTFFIGKIKAAQADQEAIKENGFPKKPQKMLFWISSDNENDYSTLEP